MVSSFIGYDIREPLERRGAAWPPDTTALTLFSSVPSPLFSSPLPTKIYLAAQNCPRENRSRGSCANAVGRGRSGDSELRAGRAAKGVVKKPVLLARPPPPRPSSVRPSTCFLLSSQKPLSLSSCFLPSSADPFTDDADVSPP